MDTAVLIVGGGPVGLSLAIRLAHVATGTLPREITDMTADPDAWVSR